MNCTRVLADGSFKTYHYPASQYAETRKLYQSRYSGIKKINKEKLLSGANTAHMAVWRAIKDGRLKNLKEVYIVCSDCPARASHWDHRDYNYPLTVEPVCQSCNARRGPAIRRRENA